MKTVKYEKVYGQVLSLSFYGQREGEPERAFNRGQWMSIPMEAGYTLRRVVIQVRRLDNEEVVELDAVGAYQGRQFHMLRVGVPVKMYHHPKCRRPWVYKLLGD